MMMIFVMMVKLLGLARVRAKTVMKLLKKAFDDLFVSIRTDIANYPT